MTSDREQYDAYFGHPGFVGSEHPLADNRPDSERYLVFVAYGDVPLAQRRKRQVAAFAQLSDALTEADNERAEHEKIGEEVFVGVQDAHNPETWLSWEDVSDSH